MIALGSRYETGVLTRIVDSSGVFQLAVLRTTPGQQVPFTMYSWTQGDRLDLVAQRLLGDPSAWWQIIDINPELIYPLNIPAGTLVRVPQVTTSQQTLLQ